MNIILEVILFTILFILVVILFFGISGMYLEIEKDIEKKISDSELKMNDKMNELKAFIRKNQVNN